MRKICLLLCLLLVPAHALAAEMSPRQKFEAIAQQLMHHVQEEQNLFEEFEVRKSFRRVNARNKNFNVCAEFDFLEKYYVRSARNIEERLKLLDEYIALRKKHVSLRQYAQALVGIERLATRKNAEHYLRQYYEQRITDHHLAVAQTQLDQRKYRCMVDS